MYYVLGLVIPGLLDTWVYFCKKIFRAISPGTKSHIAIVISSRLLFTKELTFIFLRQWDHKEQTYCRESDAIVEKMDKNVVWILIKHCYLMEKSPCQFTNGLKNLESAASKTTICHCYANYAERSSRPNKVVTLKNVKQVLIIVKMTA